MPSNLLIPVAIQAASGRYIDARAAVRGKDCGCVCPECGRAVVAKHCTIKRAHFAHLQEADCPATEESLIHRMAKAAIEENGFLWLPAIELNSERTGLRFVQNRVKCHFDRSHVEPRIPAAGGLRVIGPDILVEAAGRQLAVEITYRHPTEADKIQEYRALNLACMEIVVRDLSGETPYEDLRRMLRDDALPSGWLFNRKIDAFHREEEARSKEISDRLESERRREEAKEERMTIRSTACIGFV